MAIGFDPNALVQVGSPDTAIGLRPQRFSSGRHFIGSPDTAIGLRPQPLISGRHFIGSPDTAIGFEPNALVQVGTS